MKTSLERKKKRLKPEISSVRSTSTAEIGVSIWFLLGVSMSMRGGGRRRGSIPHPIPFFLFSSGSVGLIESRREEAGIRGFSHFEE